MRTFIIALTSAVLLAVAVTELVSRLWPGNYLALLLISAIVLLINGLFNARLTSATAVTDTGGGRSQQRKSRPKKDAGERRSESRPRGVSGKQGGESGQVKWFNRSKGYGFIIRESGEEIFVHQHSINSADGQRRTSLRDGQAVTFDVVDGNKGKQAENVSPAD